MTKTKETEEKKTNSSKKSPGEKFILYELVETYPLENWIILGALAKEGLLEEYNYQKENYEKVELKPSITVDELNKIIKNFTGE